MIKVAFFPGVSEAGQVVFPLFVSSKTDREFEKKAESIILPDVAKYIAGLKPLAGSQYVLVNAMGAGEYYSSNINGDFFPEAALIHCPDQWYGVPDIDKLTAKDWPYGFPTFYNAHPFMHHRNKDPSRAYGEVELAAWNPRMKRVELVIRIDKDKCDKFGGTGVWDKIKMGMYVDLSMGCKVPFDTCFPAGTLVRAEAGNKPIEQIVVGERVLTDAGLYQPVTAVMRRSADDLLRIVVSGLPEIVSTSNHPFLVVRREEVRACRGTTGGQRCRHSPDRADTRRCHRCGADLNFRMIWTAASDVRPGDYMVVPAQAPISRVDVALPRARMLGYYLGDGYIIKQRTGEKKDGEYRDMGVGFSVGASETAHLHRLLSSLAEARLRNEPNVYDAGCDRKAHIVSVYDQEAAAWLQEMGGRGSHGKRLDEQVFAWPLEAKLELVGAYIDMDGSFDEYTGQVRIASVNRGLLLDVQRLLLQERITATVCYAGAGSGYENGGACWYLVLSAAQAQKFMGKSVKVKPREVAWESPKSLFWEGYWLTPVTSVEELDGEQEVYNLSVEKLERYVAEGRVVHNCSICLDWDEYRKAQQTFDPKKHKYVGEAVLAYHKKLIADRGHGIRGLSITRKDYCEHARNNMNKILPDGRKVFVYNDYPRFFDISFVFIGADKTAKVMMKIASDSRIWSLPSAELAEHLGYVEEETTKVASLDVDAILKEAFEMPTLPTPATGIRRVWQRLSGSHARDLANFNARAVINELNKQRIAAGEGEGAYHAMMAQVANLGRKRDELLEKEREAVRKARIGAGVATGAVGLGGAGLAALNRAAQKEADEANEDILKVAFLGKSAKLKRGEIEKHGPTQFDSKAIPLLTQREPHLTREQIDEMCEHPLGGILSSPTSMGILLRPREFQRIVIIKMGLRPLADELEDDNVIFPRVGRPGLGIPFGPPIARILSLLSSLFSERSALSPALDRRVTLIIRRHPEGGKSKNASSHQTTLLNKIGSAYLAYRNSVMDYWSQDRRSDLEKTASSLSANTFEYLKHAYWNEVGRP
jgi:hypothetical protein